MGTSIGKICEKCGDDNWYCIDNPTSYCMICETCFDTLKTMTRIELSKTALVDEFECPDCGSLSGHAEENKRKFGVRCDNCNKLFIQFEKASDSLDNRNIADTRPKCPHCGSTNISKISTTSRMISTGLFGLASSKIGKTMECKKCGYKW